ncbi:hypothetical protein HYT32_01240 [Candidatus Roizmanbacteria bacterium]|nr:hypothetical protein [Candidatus Roizmanbacteria bacterium]
MAEDQGKDLQSINGSHAETEQSSRVRQFNELFGDIITFNKRFSTAGILGRLVTEIDSRTEAGESSGNRVVGLSKIGGEEEQLRTASGISLMHKPILDSLGISIEPVSGKYGSFYKDGEKVGIGELRVNITERSKYLSFLERLDNPDLQTKENLQSLANILAQQIYDNYNLEKPSDEALQLLGSLGKIIDQYRRLNIVGTERLETYLVHSRKKDLKEYIIIEQAGLLHEPGKYFGPADWQKNASPDYLRKRWGDAIKVLEMVRVNPNAKGLYDQLYSHLKNCLDIASKDLEELPYKEDYKSALRPVLQEIKL